MSVRCVFPHKTYQGSQKFVDSLLRMSKSGVSQLVSQSQALLKEGICERDICPFHKCLPHWDFQYFFSYHLAEVHSTGISKYEKVCFNHLRAKSLRKWTLNQGGAAAIHTWLLCPATPTSLPNLFQFILICPLLDTLKGHFLDIYLTQICQECH